MGTANRAKALLLGIMSLLVLFGLSPAGASSANISHAYQSTGAVPNGSIVSLDPKKSDFVQLANTSNGSRLLGVAVAEDDSLLAVDASDATVQVATSGTATVLVSTLNGDIRVGDQVAVSPFNGVGMKAEAGSHVIGLAQTAFNSSSEGATTQSVTDKAGNKKDVKVGQLRLSISITVNNTGVGSGEQNSLQRLTRNLTGRNVSTIRIVLSLLIAVIALLTLITLIYGAIYGSIISVGRNPLAKHAIFRTLGSVLGMVAVTATIATVMIYFLLR